VLRLHAAVRLLLGDARTSTSTPQAEGDTAATDTDTDADAPERSDGDAARSDTPAADDTGGAAGPDPTPGFGHESDTEPGAFTDPGGDTGPTADGPGADLPPGGGSVVVTRVTVPWATLLGLDDAPGELDGYGPIPAPVARRLAAQSRVWWRLLTDPVTGALCPVESTAYRIPQAVRRFVLARDACCSHPGCDRAAQRCDLDHARAWPQGPSCPCNLSPRCRRHHNAKTHHGWQVRARLDGAHATISPTGRVYSTAAGQPPGPAPERPPPDDELLDSELDWDIDRDDPGVIRLLTELADAA
jgi:hypothetical protein